MSLTMLFALAASAATSPKTTPSSAKPPVVQTAPASKDKTPDPAEVMAFMTKVMDRMFPAGPEPDPARMALARQATLTMFPNGAYAQAMNGFVDTMVDRVLSMSEADFAELMPPGTPKKKGSAAKPPSAEPLRVMLSRDDPSFDAKLAAGKAFVQTTMTKLGGVAEPRFRDGMARALARKFDARQLAEIQGFLATPTGQAYGREMVGLWFEPDVMRGTFEAFPDMMKLMPDIAKSGEALDAQMKAAAPKK